MTIYRHIPFFFIAFLLAVSCGRKDSDHPILKENTMIDVLYDYQYAMALAAEGPSDGHQAAREYKYAESVFAKHHITHQQFELSLAHYARNPQQFIEITEKVSARFSEGLQAEQAQSIASDGKGASAGDTIMLFAQDGGVLLNANEQNRAVFTIDGADLKGLESVMLAFKSNWLYREGTRNGVVLSAIHCQRDSVVRDTHNFHDYEQQNIVKVPLPPSAKVERLTFEIYQSAPWQTYPQFLSLHHVSILGIKKSKATHADQ